MSEKWTMKLLYGTGNPAKLAVMRRARAEYNADGPDGKCWLPEILGLADMDREAPRVAEDGTTPLENARQKALAYYDFYQMPVFSCDSGLYFEGVPDEIQPGVHVRTVNGKYLTDEEMLEYYSGLARQYGDLTARYRNAICLVLGREQIYTCMDESLTSKAFLLTSAPYSPVLQKGFPLDSLSVDPETSKYYYESGVKQTDQLAVEKGCVAFLRRLRDAGIL